ncbi:histidinol-phosphate aminotransferase [Nostoc linckia z18]|jgi:histidinol-phosphate aminotransferase|uniref:Histidinol-phosphate aminotransferase n=2 Tax=Nostoc linckia TaxID=92942 RepID=A0A9Q5ZFD8_NOSLI|nr:histidinol-phosphate transaminase [Nostoc linckia]PHK40116.1 histidinol-phosphate aminotransferase [Nostoc linckia z15]PHK46250.1 histidinol-phosphate aminotransferase [Nostoc linckia z16]PHJ66505.1 histidinol-phosphate aminotransferase [Nostoc linckia z1]PHJ71379.1 histidinol-phosphate aminotransferase [Nostoc linckia z3]PHJ75411.1 histidinol-phosphate aminotransferase [Nostoc linckia z2]
MTKYFRSNVDAMASYVPGEQPQRGTQIIKLNSNENPYPPSPAALAVLQNINGEWLRRYPQPFGEEFRQAASKVLGVPSDWIIVGNGSDELLSVVIRACTEPGRQVVYPMPTYVLYRTLAQMQDADITEIPYGEDYILPLEELIAVNGSVTFIASPNSPSGHVVPIDDLRKLASQLSGVLVIDEAYVDFTEESALTLVNEYENVIVIRTLSKGYSLAGLRLGFGVANPKLLHGLFKVKDSYNIDAIACAIGTAAITDQAYKNACVAKIKASRTQLAADLKQLGFQIWDSQTNFLLAQPPAGNAEYLYEKLKEQGILIRYFKQPRLEDKLRITVGTDEQNQALVEALIYLVGTGD